MKKIKKYLQTTIDLNSPGRRFYLVVFSVFSAFVFLNFFEPFGLYYDDSITHKEVFIELSIAMTLAFVVLLLSQFVIRVLFKINKFTICSLVFWFLLEDVFVASVWFLFDISDAVSSDNLLNIWIENFWAYILIMIFPYFLFVAYVHIKDVIRVLKNEYLIKEAKSKPVNITLMDENGTAKLALKTENLLFIQASSNYVEVYYLENGILSKSLLRNSIKNLEPAFTDTPIIRCHRSFIVNTNNIEIARKTSSGYDLKLNQFSDFAIPVSRSYISEFKKFLQ